MPFDDSNYLKAKQTAQVQADNIEAERIRAKHLWETYVEPLSQADRELLSKLLFSHLHDCE